MNTTISGSMIDEDVLDWLDNFSSHKQRDICEVLNGVAYAHRAELSIPNMASDEDVAALSHADLVKILALSAPEIKYGLTLSNTQLLGLALNALGIIDYLMPDLNSPIMIKRKFADTHRKNEIAGISIRDQIIKAVNEWMCGMRDMTIAGPDTAPDIAGMYLCTDEHKQIRYGRLFPNSSEGWTFCESYADGGSTVWYDRNTEHLKEDDLPMTLLTNWVLVSEWFSPNVKAAQKAIPINGVSETHRIFMFLRSLSPHVKAELVAHFDGILDKQLPNVDAIGRLTDSDWKDAAKAIADDKQLPDTVTSWADAPTWSCFVGVMDALRFNFETRQFDPQYDYQANDDDIEEE